MGEFKLEFKQMCDNNETIAKTTTGCYTQANAIIE
jgi:hypothetical protein